MKKVQKTLSALVSNYPFLKTAIPTITILLFAHIVMSTWIIVELSARNAKPEFRPVDSITLPDNFPDFDLQGEWLVRVQDEEGAEHLMYCPVVSVYTVQGVTIFTEEEQFSWAWSSTDDPVIMSHYKCNSGSLGRVEVHKWYVEIADLGELDGTDAAEAEIKIDSAEIEVSVNGNKATVYIPSPIPDHITLNDVPLVTVQE